MIIYKTTNLLNGKIYVGQDSKNNPDYFGSGKILKDAIKKYGRENFKKEILECCTSKEHMDEREKYWIKELKSRVEFGNYNLTDGGGGILNPIDDIRYKIGSANRGRIFTDEELQYRKQFYKSGIEHQSYGKKRSKEAKLKMSESHKGHTPWNKDKKGVQIAWNKDKKGVQIAWNKGIHMSEETKAKMRLAKAWSKYKKQMGIDPHNLNTML